MQETILAIALPLITAYVIYLAYMFGRASAQEKQAKEVATPKVIYKRAKEKFFEEGQTGSYLPDDEEEYKREKQEEEEEKEAIDKAINDAISR